MNSADYFLYKTFIVFFFFFLNRILLLMEKKSKYLPANWRTRLGNVICIVTYCCQNEYNADARILVSCEISFRFYQLQQSSTKKNYVHKRTHCKERNKRLLENAPTVFGVQSTCMSVGIMWIHWHHDDEHFPHSIREGIAL